MTRATHCEGDRTVATSRNLSGYRERKQGNRTKIRESNLSSENMSNRPGDDEREHAESVTDTVTMRM